MDVDLESFIERPPTEDEIRAQVHAETWRYVALTALVSLLVGIAIGRFGQDAAPRANAAQREPASPWQQASTILPASTDPAPPLPTATAAPLHVYVSGAVVEPQVITVPSDSLVADALAAVGGPAPHADLDAVNLAAPLADHQHILIPGKPDEVYPAPATDDKPRTNPTSAPTEKIDLNTATVEELQTLPGIGASRAQDIVAYREANGPFQHIEEIRNVSGIGEGIFARIEPHVTVSGGQD